MTATLRLTVGLRAAHAARCGKCDRGIPADSPLVLAEEDRGVSGGDVRVSILCTECGAEVERAARGALRGEEKG